MKKQLAALIGAAMMLQTVLPLRANAAADLILNAESVTAACKAGETVRMPVRAVQNAGYAAGIIDAEWDSTALTLAGATYDAGLAPENDPVPIEGESGSCRLAFGDLLAKENFTGTGMFFVLEFTVNDGAKAGKYPVRLTDKGIRDLNADTVQSELNSGTITLASSPDMELTAGKTVSEIGSGSEIRVPVSAISNTGYAVGSLNASWNPDVLSLKAVEYNEELAPANQPAPITNRGTYRICFGDYLTTKNFTGTGVLFTLVFTAADNAAEGIYPILFSKPDFLDMALSKRTVTCREGSVELVRELVTTSTETTVTTSETRQTTTSASETSAATSTTSSALTTTAATSAAATTTGATFTTANAVSASATVTAASATTAASTEQSAAVSTSSAAGITTVSQSGTASAETGTPAVTQTVAVPAQIVLKAAKTTAILTAGHEIRVPVSAETNKGYAVGLLNVNWDPDALILKDVEYNASLAPANQPAAVKNSGSYRVCFGDYLASENFTGTGVFFTLVFTAADGAKPDTYPVTFSKPDFLDQDINTVQVSCTDGAVILENITTTTASETVTTTTSASETESAAATSTETVPAQIVLRAETVSCNPNAAQEIRIPVSADRNEGYSVGLLNVSWNADALILKSVEYNAELAPANQPAAVKNSGSYRVCFGDYLATENFTGTGVFFTLVFTASDGAKPDTYPITFSKPDFLDKDINTVKVSCGDSAVILTDEEAPAFLLGDVNDDGEISVEDAQLALYAYVKRSQAKRAV